MKNGKHKNVEAQWLQRQLIRVTTNIFSIFFLFLFSVKYTILTRSYAKLSVSRKNYFKLKLRMHAICSIWLWIRLLFILNLKFWLPLG